MPFKNAEDKRDNARLKWRAKSLAQFRKQGLEPVDLDDHLSNLRCTGCGKETTRISRQKRHEKGCIYE